MPYSFEIVFQKEGEAAFVFDAEKQLHRDFIHYKYFPELEFDGKTECFAIGKGVVA